MADRTSAEIFRTIFTILAEDVEKNRELAKRVYLLTSNYDFNEYQMGCDEELVKLELAKEVDNIEYPGFKIVEYKERV